MPNTRGQTNHPTSVINSRVLALLVSILACISLTSCEQEDRWVESYRVAATKTPVEPSQSTVEIPTATPTEPSIPTRSKIPTDPPYPTPTAYPTNTPYPTPMTYATPARLPAETSVATSVATQARPKVSGFLLKINGRYIRPGHVSISIENGHVMVQPMTGEDGSYPARTEVTLGYYPNNTGDGVSWLGIDILKRDVAIVSMDRDREVIATIGP